MQVEQLQVVHAKFVLLPEDVPCQCLDMGKRPLLRMMSRRLVEVEETAYYDRVRDVFLFQCFTGLRYSDVFNLRRSDIKGDHIEVTTVKTSDSLIIELNNHSKAILDKYKDVAFEDDKVLPVITNQKMNDYLKELAELAGIDEPVRQTYYRGNERIDEVTQSMPYSAHMLVVEHSSVMPLHWEFLRKL